LAWYILEKFYQTSSVVGQTKDFFQDFYKIKVNEEQQFSKLDPETGKVKLVIPKLFTKTDKAIEQLSTDLNKVGSLWIKSIEEYENKKNLESKLLTLHSIEDAKGSLIMENGKVVFEPGSIKPKVNLDENKNADLLKVIINDYLYNLTENQSSLGNITISAAASKLGKKGRASFVKRKRAKQYERLEKRERVGASIGVVGTESQTKKNFKI